MPLKLISYDQLRKLMEAREEILLVNVLSAQNFKEAHIPGSINIPLEETDFETQVEEAVDGKDKKIIVYCAGFECNASRKAAEKLEHAGFSNVMAYEGGIKEWQKKAAEQQAAA